MKKLGTFLEEPKRMLEDLKDVPDNTVGVEEAAVDTLLAVGEPAASNW